ncbi:glutathione S-transferase family protein [Marinobacter vulgaris]|uniref:Glutathione S-transferase family protein n=1 Tax=Marinobacter vulgaris TaxID=1928331 RepID=A0A2V3ZW12_9GAMM|nr:glutathione S-transferase family protein [Marinobacter vulgaris]PXX89672.1 glutathione S-transferase family protein [Marinobacter vulgaris]TSJ68660.1 glutathione S-transferase family protein [Marinobacter vulgaris]
MQDFILYHYAMSPFSEKIRLMLGYADLSWQSVTVKEMPPRPELSILAGGYRKVPVAQSGADIFCDSRTIADHIARLSGRKELSLAGQPQEVIDFVRSTDLDIFLACVIAASDGRMLKKLVRETSLFHAFRFLKDRINMGRKSRLKALRGPQAKQKVISHIGTMEAMLDQDFLFGSKPCVADFSAYHGLWFVCDLAGKPWLRNFPKVNVWMGRMRAFGHGEFREITADQGLDIALNAMPRAIEATSDEPLTGRNVEIAPDDYGRDPVIGKLVYADDRTLVLGRSHQRVGQVHVHFPRQGYAVKPA